MNFIKSKERTRNVILFTIMDNDKYDHNPRSVLLDSLKAVNLSIYLSICLSIYLPIFYLL